MNNKIISGALFDFMGWLTTRPKRIMLSSVDDAAPAADAIKEFAKMRGLSLDDARVQDWREALAQERSSDEQPAQQKPVSRVLSQQEMAEAAKRYTSPPAQRQAQSADTWIGLTDGQIVASNYPDGEENGPTIAAPDFELICFARQIEAAHGIKENT